ncbi:MAG: DedA family protein [Ktedonobacteraceae bacterium]|nr:DedA family protein [Ktedonobacteraceae bacterium]
MLDPGNIQYMLETYSYWAVLLFIMIESTGIPFPGETMLITASIYAGTTHRLSLPLIIGAASLGAILGDNLGWLIGREGGYRLLRRYGRYIRLDEGRLKLGQYLFLKHGGKVVFFGRFVAVLRTWSAFLAGTNCMPWGRFLLYNALGGITWSSFYGIGAYVLGSKIHDVSGKVGTIMLILAILLAIAGLIFLRYHEKRLIAVAEHALPGPLDDHRPAAQKAAEPSDPPR